MNEVWKQYRDTRYDVSNLGNVRSTDRPDMQGHVRPKQSGVLKQKLTKRGYNQVSISGKWTSVHRMVAETFLGLPEDTTYVVDHINSVPTDNRLVNLQWLSPSENIKKAFDDGRVPPKSVDKRTGDVLVFKSSIEASAHFNRSKGYFREVVTKKGGENIYFKVRDI